MKVINQYPQHYYEEDYIKTGLFCPSCGEQEIWEKLGMGDYYLGVNYLCTNCDTSHCLDHSCANARKEEKFIIEQLKSGITATPTTKKGS